jgi:uncharacterized protein (TIGR02001 family)
MKKKSALVTSLLSLGAAGVFAQATPAPAAPEPPVPLTANINLTTKYKFRGQDQGNTDWFSPALQGGFDWSASGFYIGNWNSNVSFSNAALEMDFYAGYKGEITKEFGYDVGILQYYYPQKDKVVSFDTTELYAALTWTFLTLKYSHTISSDYFGFGKFQQMAASDAGSSLGGSRGQNTGYIELNASFPLMDKLTLVGHVGYTNFAKDLNKASFDDGLGGTIDVGLKDYTDYKVGLTYDMSTLVGAGTSAAIAYVGANKTGFYGDINKGRVILTFSKAM